MGKRRVLLIVFSISSILVLAGFAANEKAYAGLIGSPPPGPPFGDFTCWKSVEPAQILVQSFVIEDQFGTTSNADWQQIEYCTATEKFGPGSSPFSFTQPVELAQHYQSWLYVNHFPGPGTDVLVNVEVPQFENFQVTLGLLDQIMLPATKFIDGPPVESFDTFHHWNCYDIEEQVAPINAPVQLHTQHGDIITTVLDPFLFCAPMLKDNEFGNKDLEDHMVCYNLGFPDFNDSFNLPFALADQLTAGAVGPGNPFPFIIDVAFNDRGLEKLCVPALKSFPVIGGFNVPIDTSSLLLAGVSSVSMWMIPVVIAGIGIAIFVIKRRN